MNRITSSGKMQCMEIHHNFRLDDYMFARFDRVVFSLSLRDVAHLIYSEITRSCEEIAKLSKTTTCTVEDLLHTLSVIYRPLTETSLPLPAWKLTDYIFVVQRRTKFERESAV